IYKSGDFGNITVELFINVGCLSGGAAIIGFAWKHRHYFLRMESRALGPAAAAATDAQPGVAVG
ncbi:MAG TPA: hypothetical protein VGY54_22785, partial [Polyangiaceae bacterium]|nr:hypothetical protein [Polyangiaceae bacterium]